MGEVTELTITWGGESIQPCPYNNFQVGPIEVKVSLRPGETVEQAEAYWNGKLKEMCETQAAEKFNQWHAHFRAAQRAAS